MKEPTRLLILILAGCLLGVLVFLPIDELCATHEKPRRFSGQIPPLAVIAVAVDLEPREPHAG
jgi:hypothetical protein